MWKWHWNVVAIRKVILICFNQNLNFWSKKSYSKTLSSNVFGIKENKKKKKPDYNIIILNLYNDK